MLCLSITAQESVLFHFNFSFERDYIDLYKWTSNEDVKIITIEVYNPKKHLNWIRSFTFNDIPKDKNGYCLFSDTIKTLKSSPGSCSMKVNYKLTSGIDDSCELFFSYPDSVNKLALELYFDQAFIVRSNKDTLRNIIFEEYGINRNPKPVLVVKYLDSETGVYLGPLWFEHFRITKRPVYILYNNSDTDIYRVNDEMFTCFFGELQISNSGGEWQPYWFGGRCGTFSCENKIRSGGIIHILEGYPIGDPKKLIQGFYKYFVQYKDINGDEKMAITYFSVVYIK